MSIIPTTKTFLSATVPNLVVDRDYKIVAKFEPTTTTDPSQPTTSTVNIRANSSPTNGGQVSVKRVTISKPLEQDSYATTQGRTYEIGDTLVFDAQAASGFFFLRWVIRRSSSGGVNAALSTSIRTMTVVVDDINFPGITQDETLTFIAEFQQFVSEPPSDEPTAPPPSNEPTAPTPTPSAPSSQPSLTPTPTPAFLQPTPTPAPTLALIQPTPTPTPELWRSCIDGKLYAKPIPGGYRSAEYDGSGGGVCWEPITQVGIHPNINDTIFTYRRASGEFPAAKKFTLDNPSYGVSYSIKVLTNTTLFRVEPEEFQLTPRAKQDFTISVREDTIESFGDGATIFDLQLEILEI
jgi:hypothetical protein